MGLQDERIWNSFALQFVWEFVLGIIIADHVWKGNTFILNNAVLLMVAIVGIGLQSVMALSSGGFKIFNDIPALCGYSALALLLTNVPFIRFAATWLSKISYEYYLIHILELSV